MVFGVWWDVVHVYYIKFGSCLSSNKLWSLYIYTHTLQGWLCEFDEIDGGYVLNYLFFPTCQVRVVRFYVSCLLLLSSPLLLISSPPPPRRPPRPPRPTATLDAQWSLSDLNHDHPRPVFPAGPQPRPSPPSVPCRTSTTTIHAQCSLPDLNREYPRPVFPAGPQPRPSTPSVPCRTSTASIHAKRYAT